MSACDRRLSVLFSPPQKNICMYWLPPQVQTMASGEAGGVQQGSKQVQDSDGVNPVGLQRTKRFHFLPSLFLEKKNAFNNTNVFSLVRSGKHMVTSAFLALG